MRLLVVVRGHLVTEGLIARQAASSRAAPDGVVKGRAAEPVADRLRALAGTGFCLPTAGW